MLSKIRNFEYIILIIGSVFIISFLREIKFSTIKAEIFFNIWVQLPQVAIAAILFKFKKYSKFFLLKIVLLILVLFSLGYLMDVIYFSQDAQGAIAILILPVIQYVFLSVILVFISIDINN